MMMLFLFDMDNVLYDYNWRVRMYGLEEITGHDFHELRRRWWHDEGEWLAEKGDPPTGAEYLQRVNQALERELSVDQWLLHRRVAMTPREDIIEVARYAKSHGQIAVLTNNGALIGEHLAEIAPELVPVFGDQLFATAHFKARKPEPEVFRNTLAGLGFTAEQTLFFDDMPDNVRGAESIGITAQWHGPQHTAADMTSHIDRFVERWSR